MIQALIFDMDGVLIDSEHPTFVLLQRLAEKRGYSISDDLHTQRIGKKISVFVEQYMANTMPEDERLSLVQEFYDTYKGGPEKYYEPIMPTISFLTTYDGPMRLALASVSSRAEIDKILDMLHLGDRFEVVVSSDDITHLKPHPEIYTKAAELLHLSPGSCVAVEDSAVGAQSAISAGIPTYGILNGVNNKNSFAGLQLAGFVRSEADLRQLAELA